MAYLYSAMWLLVGLILIFRMGRENRVFYPIGIFFLFLGVWWLAGQISGINMFTGAWGWTLRGITAVALVLACIVFFREIRKNNEEYNGRGGDSGE